jgi:hypothetical protein
VSETVWIVLIIAVAVIVVLYMFRGALASFFLKATQEGFEAGLETREQPPSDDQAEHSPADVNVSDTWQIGRKNKIAVGRSDTNVSKSRQIGEEQEITVEPDTKADPKE